LNLISDWPLWELASAEVSQEPDATMKPEDAIEEDSADAEDAAWEELAEPEQDLNAAIELLVWEFA
jgi:hypothetical protein